MTAPQWRKSSHSGHAGQNCVEIALSTGHPTRSHPPISRRDYERAKQRRSGRWYVSSRA
ncbi:MAG: DUF397 domain-containing protein [Actinoallomurus sp.]